MFLRGSATLAAACRDLELAISLVRDAWVDMRVLSIDPGRRHCAICLLDVGKDCRARDDEVLAWFLTDVNSSSVPHVIEAMRVVAQRLPAEVGVVLIEKQVGSNHVACRVENAIHAFFLMSGHDVVLVDPKRKYAYLQKSGLYSGGFPNGHAGAKLSPFHRKRITASYAKLHCPITPKKQHLQSVHDLRSDIFGRRPTGG